MHATYGVGADVGAEVGSAVGAALGAAVSAYFAVLSIVRFAIVPLKYLSKLVAPTQKFAVDEHP
jgi:hypothetical protein